MLNHGLVYTELQLRHNETQTVVQCIKPGGAYFISIEWSPNGNYAAVDVGHHRSTETGVFDTTTGEFILMPDDTAIKTHIGEEAAEWRNAINRRYAELVKWVDDTSVHCDFYWQFQINEDDGNEPLFISGRYVYDVKNEVIIDLEYELLTG
jgi:hypothetical protein